MITGLEKVREIAGRVAASHGIEVFEVEWLGGAGKQGRVVRIYLDRPVAAPSAEGAAQGGITLEDCANVSREVSAILDVENAVGGGEYVLEVSSPGLDRPLRRPQDFARFVGSRVKVMTREPLGVTASSKGNRHFEGRMQQIVDGKLILDLTAAGRKQGKRQAAAGAQVEVPLEAIERANLVPEI